MNPGRNNRTLQRIAAGSDRGDDCGEQPAQLQEASGKVLQAADAAKANSNLSKDLRPVLRRYETAMRNIADGTRIIDSWEASLQEVA